jgi:hypothetical protein
MDLPPSLAYGTGRGGRFIFFISTLVTHHMHGFLWKVGTIVWPTVLVKITHKYTTGMIVPRATTRQEV